MTPGPLVRLLAAAALVLAAAPVSGQPVHTPPQVQLLDVPYVPQSEALCGGAAVAMVMRYWGATGIYAEDFAPLVDRRAKGIRGEDLLDTLQRRRWSARSFRGDAQIVAQSLAAKQPPIALIEDRPGRFHYVVIVSWTGGKVIAHDPARRPFETYDDASFLRSWSRSGYWTMVALPPPVDMRTASLESTGGSPTLGACGPRTDEAIALAKDGKVEDAGRLLEHLTVECPSEVAPWRELAGVRVLRKDWAGAAADARRALAIDGTDEHAARILATSLFVSGDPGGALEAWNMVGEPTVDLVSVRGLERTRYAVAVRALGLPSETRLTPGRLIRATRRLESMPSVMGSSVSYMPREDGLAQVTAAVVERPVLPTTPVAVGAIALRAAIDRELQLDVLSPTGGAERWFVRWRWWEARPRVQVGLEAPAPFGGTWSVTATDERESYGFGSEPYQERRRSVALAASDWLSATWRWSAELRAERWPASESAAAAVGSVLYRATDERLAIGGRAGWWAADTSTWTGGAFADWRSNARTKGTVWIARAGFDAAGKTTPFALWSGAGTGQGRAPLLRAHPLLDDGVIRDAVFGRAVASGGAEWRRWSTPVLRVLRIAPAAFIDVARAYDVPSFADPRAHADAGIGVRLALPGAGVLRADLARGLHDGKVAFSVGFAR